MLFKRTIHPMTRGLTRWFQRRSRPRRGFRISQTPAAEVLESRELLTTLVYVDFGAALAQSNTNFQTTVDEVRKVVGKGWGYGAGTGPDMNDALGLPGSSTLTFKPFNYDWNGNGTPGESADFNEMSTAVLELVNRALEPLAVDAVAANADSLKMIKDTLRFDNTWKTSSHGGYDAYVFAGEVHDNQGSIGVQHSMRELAALEDHIYSKSNGLNSFYAHNGHDELAITFADQVLKESSASGNQGDPFANRRLAFRLSDSILRNAMRTFGVQETGHATNPDLQQMTLGDSVRQRVSSSDDALTHNIISNVQLPRPEYPGYFSNYDYNSHYYLDYYLDSDELGYNPFAAAYWAVGFRDDNQNFEPDVAYITGTGAHDRITVKRGGPNVSQFKVQIEAFSDPNKTPASLIRSFHYLIPDYYHEGSLLIDASLGHDEVIVDAKGWTGRMTIRGGDGNDTILAGNNPSVIFGDAGSDWLKGGVHDDTIHGGYGSDTVFGNFGADRIFGERGTLYVGGGESDSLYGEGGTDEIRGDGGADFVHGGKGSDSLFGGAEDDTIFGGNGDDLMNGGAGNDVMFGEDGRDVMSGGVGRDRMDGGLKADFMRGDQGRDTMYGRTGNDTILGGIGADSLRGGNDDDEMYANDFNVHDDQAIDWVWGNLGLDDLYGSIMMDLDQLNQ